MYFEIYKMVNWFWDKQLQKYKILFSIQQTKTINSDYLDAIWIKKITLQEIKIDKELFRPKDPKMNY